MEEGLVHDQVQQIFDYRALDAASLQREPFDHVHVPQFIRAAALARANEDFPEIRKPGNYTPDECPYGPGFKALIDALEEDAFIELMSRKFGVDLSSKPTTVTVRAFCELSDGDIHTDHRSKVVTALLYFNTDWHREGGQLRLLRSATDIEDVGAEIPPLGGTLIAFRRSDKSFHGHKRFVGERRMLQLSWLEPSTAAQLRLRFDRVGTRLMKSLSRLGSG